MTIKSTETGKPTNEELIAALKAAVKKAGSQRQFALDHGFHHTFISHVLSGDMPITNRLMEAAGYRRVVVWERIEEGKP